MLPPPAPSPLPAPATATATATASRCQRPVRAVFVGRVSVLLVLVGFLVVGRVMRYERGKGGRNIRANSCAGCGAYLRPHALHPLVVARQEVASTRCPRGVTLRLRQQTRISVTLQTRSKRPAAHRSAAPPACTQGRWYLVRTRQPSGMLVREASRHDPAACPSPRCVRRAAFSLAYVEEALQRSRRRSRGRGEPSARQRGGHRPMNDVMSRRHVRQPVLLSALCCELQPPAHPSKVLEAPR